MKIRDKPLLLLLQLLLALTVQVLVLASSRSPLEESARRRIRAISYPEESLLGLFFALAVPLDDPHSSKAVNVAFFFEANYKLPHEEEEEGEEELQEGHAEAKRSRWAIDRSTLYRALQSKFDSLGFPGRQCLLRSICETARELRPEHRHNGLIGDLMRITFTPSTSASEEGPDSEEYALAEELGRDSCSSSSAAAAAAADCASIYPSCPFSIYQHITDVLD